MRDSHSADKDYLRFSRHIVGQVFNPYRQLGRKKPETTKSEAEIIQQFYYSQMLQLYQKNQNSYPNPVKILQNLKAKDRKLEELQRSLVQCQQKLRLNQKSAKTELKTQRSLRPPEQQSWQMSSSKTMEEQYTKMKLKFIPILQEYLGDSQNFLQLSRVQNQATVQFIYECVNNIIRDLKRQIIGAEQKMTQKLGKKYQGIEARLQKQIADQHEMIKRLNERVNGYMEQLRVQSEERKKSEKEKNDLHTEIYKIHQGIVEKSNVILKLREDLEAELRKNQGFEAAGAEFMKKISTLENKVKEIEQNCSELDFKNKELTIINQKLEKEVSSLRKRPQESHLVRNLSKIRSEQTLTSLQFINQQQDKKGQLSQLKLTIKTLQKQAQLKNKQSQNLKMQYERRQRTNLQKIINEWRQHLERIVNDNDREAKAKDNLIEALEKEVAQLKREIQLRKSMEPSTPTKKT